MVDVHASLDSTNLEAFRAPRPWRVVVADHQSAGRGRMSRQWQAPACASIAVSCLVPVAADRTADWNWLPLLSGMAMRQALAEVADVAGRLKWPNDVMVRERSDDPGAPWLKISGVLCEMVPGAGLVVIGAGTNIDQTRGELPVQTATSLALCGAGNVRREDVIVRYLGVLVDLHRAWSGGGAGLDAMRAAYRSSCLTIGLDVDVHQPDGRVVRGTATGVDDAGRLMVQAGGSSTAYVAGDVTHLRRSQPAAGNTA
jgi:BirA family biotin operon repressor/biotin-[acetyl-CoA-carboxylase] ligase